MDVDQLVAAAGIYVATFVIAVVGSILPLVSIEVFLVGLTLAIGPEEAVPVVLLAALGQVLGKLPVYLAARRAAELAAVQPRVARIRTWVAAWRRSPAVVLAASAALGLPPFSLAATAAGLLAIELRTFCIVVAIGRAVRFAAIIALTATA